MTVALPLRRRVAAPAPAPVVPARTLRVVPARVRRRRLLSALVTVVVLTGFGVAATHVLIAQGQFQLARIQEDAGEAQARYDRLRLEVAELESPGRVVAAAQQRLGMVPPPEVTYLTPVGGRRVAAAPARSSRPAATATASGPTSWSLVKPHLAER